MKLRELFLCAFILPACFFVPAAPVGADVRVELKNGAIITAEACRENEESLTCSKMGGSFEIEKKNIASLKNIPGESSPEPEIPAENGNGSVSVDSKAEKGDAEKVGRGESRNDLEKKLDDVRQKKRELSKEHQDIVKERELLLQEMKKAPEWMTEQQFSDAKKKTSDFDAKLKKYNDEVIQLNNEEKQIIEKSGTKAKQQPEATSN